MGTASHLFIKPWAAMFSGVLGGFICMIAFHYLTVSFCSLLFDPESFFMCSIKVECEIYSVS